MPPIPATTLTEIRTACPMSRYLESRGVELTRSGQDFVCSCPLPEHDDQTPSFHITTKEDGDVGHCFGCDWAGNVFQLIQRLEECDFLAAVARAARLGGVAFDDARYRTRRPAKPAPTSCPLDPEASDAELGRQVVGFYHSRLLERGSAGWAYLERRGLADAALAARYRLGFAERGALGRSLPSRKLVAGKTLRSRLESAGWMKGASGHEFFAGSLVVPIFDADGAVVNAYGRKVGRGLRPGVPDHLYLPGSNDQCWNLPAFTRADGAAVVRRSVVLCEAPLDALTFARHGCDNVTFAYGALGLKEAHIAAFRAADVRDVFLAYDADLPGERGAQAAAQRLIAAGMSVYRVTFPAGSDVNAFALDAGDDAGEALAQAVHAADWLGGARAVPVPTVDNQAEAVAASPEKTASPAGAGDDPAALPGIDDVQECHNKITIRIGNRRWRLLGLEQATTLLAIKVGLRVSVGDDYHQDRCDLANHRQRSGFVTEAGREVPVETQLLASDMKKLLLFAETWLERRESLTRAAAAAAARPQDPAEQLTAAERDAALALLRDPALPDRIIADLEACGLVGERVNKLTAYLAATSRRMERPLAVLVQSSSAAGKTTLMDAILALMPEEDARRYSALSPKALYYLGHDQLRHKILAIAEEEGAEAASYSLKLLQSDKALIFGCPMKQPDGSIRTEEIRIDGPIMLFLTTTQAIIADSELENRCVKLSVDEDAAQTAAIHARQRNRDTWDGVGVQREAQALRVLHRNAQRLLRPLTVVNPYAPKLTFATDRPRLRRDHQKYLDLIKAITFLHQYQREHETRVIAGRSIAAVITAPADIALANELAHVVLGRCLDDLPPQPRRLLELLWDAVQPLAQEADHPVSRYDWTIRQVLPYVPYGNSQLRAHLAVLVAHDYIVAHRGHATEPLRYRLLCDERPAERSHICLGLLNPETSHAYDAPFTGSERPFADRLPTASGSFPDRFRTDESAENPKERAENGENGASGPNEHKRGPFSGDVVTDTDGSDDDDAAPVAQTGS